MTIKSKLTLTRQPLLLATGVLLATAALTLTTQSAVAATQSLGSIVDIQPRDITTQHHAYLHFGKVKVGPSGGTISVTNDATNTFAATGDATHIDDGYAGRLGIQGEKGHTVSVSVDSTITLTANNQTGAADITVTTAPQDSAFTLTADNGSWNLFYIGGTLTIPANQPADRYRGNYTATVEYQ